MVIANDLKGELVPQWDDLTSPPSDLFVPGVPNLPDFDPVNVGVLFDAAATETVYFSQQLKHSYKEGSNIIPHIHWEPTNTNTGNVYWRLEYNWKNIGESDPGWTTINILQAAGGEALVTQIASFGEIDGTGKEISSTISYKLSRIGGDGTDTYNVDALVKEFDTHFQMDTRGSVQETSKT